MRREVRTAIKEITDYLRYACKEDRDFQASGRPRNHIYKRVLIVERWLKEARRRKNVQTAVYSQSTS